MAETTIEWTKRIRYGWHIPGFTFNAWIGCEKVSQGCKNCYASVDTFARVSKSRGLPLWGPDSTRHKTSAANWKEPLRWAKKARKATEIVGFDVRPAVFAQSLSDTFEDRRDLDAWRRELFDLIGATPELDWILVTKRIDKVIEMVPASWLKAWPINVIVLASVENQEEADRRIPHLLRIPGKRGLSVEPLLGPVDLAKAYEVNPDNGGTLAYPLEVNEGGYHAIDWIIVGGESGPNARPMHPDWVRSIREQCVAASVPFFFKQWGSYMPAIKEEFWHEYGFPGFMGTYGGKSARVLDGRTWDGVPQ